MASMWGSPPPIMAIGGSADFLRIREVNNAILQMSRRGRRIEIVEEDNQLVDGLQMAATFGEEVFFVLHEPAKLDPRTAEALRANQPKGTSLLLVFEGPYDELKFPVIAGVHGAHQVQHNLPMTARGTIDKRKMAEMAATFARREADLLVEGKKALSLELSKRLIEAVGSDLGVVSFEVLKVAMLLRSEGRTEILASDLKRTLRATSEVDVEPLREALKTRDLKGCARALERLGRNGGDPVMLLLGPRGSPTDLAITWLRAALLAKSGSTPDEIAQRMGLNKWILEKDILPTAKRWGVTSLRELVHNLAVVDRRVRSCPAPYIALQAALLRSVAGTS